MPEDKENGKNGGRVGLVDRVKDDVQSLKTEIPAKAKEQIEGLKDPTKTQVYTSIFRHKHDHTPQTRPGRAFQRLFAPAPRENQSRRGALQLYVGHGRNHVLLIYRSDLHRRVAHV